MIYVYLAAPVRPLPGSGETKAGNLALALEYYRQLSLRHLDCVFLMPWWVNCHAFEETPEMVELGMKRNLATIGLIVDYERSTILSSLAGARSSGPSCRSAVPGAAEC